MERTISYRDPTREPTHEQRAESPLRTRGWIRQLRRSFAATACIGLALTSVACSPGALLGGAAIGAVGAGAVYERENRQALDELRRSFERGEISKQEYLERRDEIADRSILD